VKTKLILQSAILSAGFALAAGPVGATTNMFTPVTGAEFVSDSGSAAVTHVGGRIINGASVTQRVEASLGHAAGGTSGFTFYGNGNGLTVTCKVLVLDVSNGGASFFYSNSVTTTGTFTMFVQTTPPSGGDDFYTAICDLPQSVSNTAASIRGVKPDH